MLDWNQSAIRFYESIGAVLMDERTGYRLTGEALPALGSTTIGRIEEPHQSGARGKTGRNEICAWGRWGLDATDGAIRQAITSA